jgi:hypothetical protein
MFMYYLKHEKECFIIFKTRVAAERFRYDKMWEMDFSFRLGEAANIDVVTFESKSNWNNIHNKEIFKSLSPSEQQLCQR